MKGFPTTWGSPAFTEQQFDYDASVVEMLRDAGAVLIAKLATGELAAGDNWFGGQTKSPWDPTQGSSGSSAGPASATAAGVRGLRHRHRDERIDPEPGGPLRRGRPAARPSAASAATARWRCRGRRIGSGRSAATPRTARW